jgi:hypothetical protein
MNDYVTQSGDLAFLRDHWDNAWRAYQFLRSTYDAQGFAQNAGVGHGWVEGGPLLPVKNEFYQAGLGVVALRALSSLAAFAGKDDLKKQLATEFDQKRALLDQSFWSPEKKIYAFGLTQNNQRSDEASVLATVSMWFGLPDPGHADQMITQLSEAEHDTDWGMRIISSQSRIYDGSGYHFGSVWPLFTGWASVGEYKYHRALPAYFNLRANALLALDGSLGHFTEVLSGDYYQSLSTSSPHQIWSAAMVVSPILRGMFGLQIDAANHTISLIPHAPADWTSFAIHNVHVGAVAVDFQYHKTTDSLVLETKSTGTGECWINFSPALSPRAHVVGVEWNGRPLAFKVQSNGEDKSGSEEESQNKDQHVSLRFPARAGSNRVVIRVKNDFGLSLSNELPPLGSTSRELRVLSESWNPVRTQLKVEVSGLPGTYYELGVWNPSQVSSVDGATLSQGKIHIEVPQSGDGIGGATSGEGTSEDYRHSTVVFHFAKP